MERWVALVHQMQHIPLDYRMRETFERLPQDASDEVALNAVESVLKILAAVSPRSPLPPGEGEPVDDNE